MITLHAYDLNGNMTRDPNRGMTTHYDFNNRPVRVDFDSGDTIEYLYDAAGNRLRTVHSVVQAPTAMPGAGDVSAAVADSTDYCGSIIYSGRHISRVDCGGGVEMYG